MVLLFLPKLLSIMPIWCKGTKEYGGFWRVTLSLLLEVLFSVLLAPVRMLFHTVFVVSAFLGWKWFGTHRNATMILRRGEQFLMRHGSQPPLGLVSGGYEAGFTLSFLAGADCLSLILSPFVSAISQSFNGRITHQTLEAVPDPGRVFAASGVGRYDKCLGDESPPYSGRWLYACGI